MHSRRIGSMNLRVCSQSWKFYDAKFNVANFITKINRKKLSAADKHHNLQCLQELDGLENKGLFKSTLSSGSIDKPLKVGSLTARTEQESVRQANLADYSKSINGKTKNISIKYKPLRKAVVQQLNILDRKVMNSRQASAVTEAGGVANKKPEFVLPCVDDSNELKGRYVKLLSKRTVGETLPVIKPIPRADFEMYTKNMSSEKHLKRLAQRKFTVCANLHNTPSLQEANEPRRRRNDAIYELCRSIDHILAGNSLTPL
eukprot:TRINITY_DN6266_c0_g1_i6.p1 TRINITY_DN6266_c0_g1~~TRINITY_DN6266_c0_g1_i6.p1  ORF type:complete len:292 (-),score=33.41 TRINITY_DN6266_c0_g1_i6:120-896(-)